MNFHRNVSVAQSHGFHSPKPYGGSGGGRMGAAMSHPSGGALYVKHSGEWAHHNSNGREIASGHAGNLHEHLSNHFKKAENPMNFNKAVGFQTSPLTDLQKSFHAPGNEDGGITLDAITVIDEGIGIEKSEFVAYFNAADLRQGLLEALARGEVSAQDVALVDTKRIRKSVAEKLGMRPMSEPRGEWFRKGGPAARAMSHASSQQHEQRQSGSEPHRAMLAKFKGAKIDGASAHKYGASAHGDGSCIDCGHGPEHPRHSDLVTKAYTAYAADPSNSLADLRAAAAELDALVERNRGE